MKVGPEIAATTGEVLGKQVTEEQAKNKDAKEEPFKEELTEDELSALSGGETVLEGQEAAVKPKRHTPFLGA